MGDATGTLGLQAFGSPHGVTLHVVDGDTGQQRAFTSNWDNSDGSFTPQPNGFVGVMKAPTSNTWSVHDVDAQGNYVSASPTIDGTLVFTGAAGHGVLLAGNFSWLGSPPRRQAWFFDPTDLSWGRDLASNGAVFGLGTDVQNRALVITDGARAGDVNAQWFDSNGAALTGEFTILSAFQPGRNTWFETAPLIGGGVAVRRMDQQNDPNGRPYRTAQWLVTVPPGVAHADPAPQWMKDRPNTNLAIARSGHAYAVLPMGAPGASCAQSVELVSPDGTSCGSFDVSIGTGTCRTEDMALSRDGTPIQLMPRELWQPGTCSYRWWQHALQ
jgi:hypothetical protein